MTRVEVLEKAINITTGDRQKQNGDADSNFKNIATLWSAYLGGAPISSSEVAMMMVLLKVARSKSGNYNSDDFVDMCGYAALGSEIQQLENISNS